MASLSSAACEIKTSYSLPSGSSPSSLTYSAALSAIDASGELGLRMRCQAADREVPPQRLAPCPSSRPCQRTRASDLIVGSQSRQAIA
jgi:hypothetical protein